MPSDPTTWREWKDRTMPDTPLATIDLAAPDFVHDPYPGFARERALHPVAWHEPTQMYLGFSHAANFQIQRDRKLGRLWTDRTPLDYLEPFNLLHRNQMMENEPPEHTRLRRPVAASFNRGHVERLRPRVREISAGLLEQVDPSGFDLMADYAEPLPVLVICELLGMPSSHADELRAWSQAIVRMYETSAPREVVDAAVRAAVDFAAFVRDFVGARRANPVDDLVSDLAATELSDDEVIASVVLLLNAGHEASVNGFGNGLPAILSAYPGFGRTHAPSETKEWALVVEEMLRYDTPAQLFERTAIEPVEVGGVVVEPGQKIAALLGAANRDPEVFDAPDELRLDRDPNPHLAFGAGVHFCLGAPLARMELNESMQQLFSAFPDLALDGDPVSRGTFVLRGNARVPVVGA